MTIVCCCWQRYNVILSNFYFDSSCIYRICMKSGGRALYIGVIGLHIELCGIFRNFYPLTQAWIRDDRTIIRLQWVHICLCHFPSYWVFPDSSVGKESSCNAGDPSLIPGSGRSAGEGIATLGFPFDSAGKGCACNVGDLGWIPGLGRFPREGKGYPLQYSVLENSMDCIVHGDAKSRTWLCSVHVFQKIEV